MTSSPNNPNNDMPFRLFLLAVALFAFLARHIEVSQSKEIVLCFLFFFFDQEIMDQLVQLVPAIFGILFFLMKLNQQWRNLMFFGHVETNYHNKRRTSLVPDSAL